MIQMGKNVQVNWMKFVWRYHRDEYPQLTKRGESFGGRLLVGRLGVISPSSPIIMVGSEDCIVSILEYRKRVREKVGPGE